ncbi:hypothetical protein [Limisalsivibrio acetivorans]|uniref:hypothetical protein n=1 Tax=Limisalsivibrio acetivorans TaxID=1304888 RepID=UPI0003B6883F|nr:hypothetical protein [Limisalsivibrio acetivorans]
MYTYTIDAQNQIHISGAVEAVIPKDPGTGDFFADAASAQSFAEDWIAARTPQPRPALVVTSVSSDDSSAQVEEGEITILQGHSVTAGVEIQLSGALYTNFSGTFRMPVRTKDGREMFALVSISAGTGQVTIPFDSSGHYEITEAGINERLPASQQLSFEGFSVYVVV